MKMQDGAQRMLEANPQANHVVFVRTGEQEAGLVGTFESRAEAEDAIRLVAMISGLDQFAICARGTEQLEFIRVMSDELLPEAVAAVH